MTPLVRAFSGQSPRVPGRSWLSPHLILRKFVVICKLITSYVRYCNHSSTTVPLKRFKLRTGTPPQTEARRARCVSTHPLSASGDSGWPPSTTVQSARAVHARTSQYGRPRACLPRSSDDQSQGGLFVASVAARGDTGVPSGHR